MRRRQGGRGAHRVNGGSIEKDLLEKYGGPTPRLWLKAQRAASSTLTLPAARDRVS
jgi:hypothetical protein